MSEYNQSLIVRNGSKEENEQIPFEFSREYLPPNIQAFYLAIDALMIIEEQTPVGLLNEFHQKLVCPNDFVLPLQEQEDNGNDGSYEAEVFDGLAVRRIIAAAILCQFPHDAFILLYLVLRVGSHPLKE